MPVFFKKHAAFFGWFSAAFFLSLYPLFSLKQGLVLNDYALQFYPWTRAYAEALRSGNLLLWTPLIQSGFPLFAEGQTGMLYPLNLLFFGLWPFSSAYNLLFLLHFAVLGVSCYLLGRRLRLSNEASTLAAVLFSFGSAMGGLAGSFIAMRAMVWLPLMLLAAEIYLEKSDKRSLFWLALLGAQSWFSGAPQTALYVSFFSYAYFISRLFSRPDAKRRRFRAVVAYGISLACSGLIASAQLIPTMALARESTRTLQEKAFALWGSVAPWSLATLFMYSWGPFLRFSLYIGTAPFLLILFSSKRSDGERTMWMLAIFSFLLALGRFNPLYWVFVQFSVASFLRNPSKFLYFTAFFLSYIAAFSWDRLITQLEEPPKLRAYIQKLIFYLAIFLLIACTACFFVQNNEALLLRFGRWYTEHFVLGRSFHRGSVREYAEKLRSLIFVLKGELRFSSPFFWLPFAFGLGFITLLMIKARRQIGRSHFTSLWFILVIADLMLFGKCGYGTGLYGNIGPFPDPSPMSIYDPSTRWLDTTSGDDALFPPNRNMLSGHASVGAYSPLLNKDYYQLVADLGVLDDSLGCSKPVLQTLNEARPLLNFLGVRHVVTEANTELQGFSLERRDSKRRFYENSEARNEFSVVYKETTVQDPEQRIRYLRSKRFDPSQEVVLAKRSFLPVHEKLPDVPWPFNLKTDIIETRVDLFKPGWLVRNQVYDGSWRVTVDGKKNQVEEVDHCFQGVRVPAGVHKVAFRYEPRFFASGVWLLAAAFLSAVVIGIRLLYNR